MSSYVKFLQDSHHVHRPTRVVLEKRPLNDCICVLKSIEIGGLLTELVKKQRCGRFIWVTVYIYICIRITEWVIKVRPFGFVVLKNRSKLMFLI